MLKPFMGNCTALNETKLRLFHTEHNLEKILNPVVLLCVQLTHQESQAVSNPHAKVSFDRDCIREVAIHILQLAVLYI